MIHNEIWKDIPDLEGLYQVNPKGQVRNRRGRILKARCRKDGYYQINITKSGKRKTLSVHRVVAEVFIPNPNNYPQVNHIDRNLSHNNKENLEWCTASENMRQTWCAIQKRRFQMV